MTTQQTNPEELLQTLKADVKKTVAKNNGRLTPDQIAKLCQYKRMTAVQTQS